MSKDRGMGITEQEMNGLRNGIPKDETYNSYGGEERKVVIKAYWGGGRDSIMRVRQWVPRREKCVYGRFVYTAKPTPLEDCHTKQRHTAIETRLDGRSCVEGSAKGVASNASEHPFQLMSSIIYYCI